MTSNSVSGSDLGLSKLTQEEIDDLRREMKRDGLWAKKKLRTQRARRTKPK